MAAGKEIVAVLGVDTRQVKDGLKKADGYLSNFQKKLLRLGSVLGGVFTFRRLSQEFKGTILDSAALIETARGAGLATQEYEKLGFVFEQLGTTSDYVRQTLGDFQIKLHDTTRQYDKFYRQLGLNPNDLRKKTPYEQLRETLAAIQRIEDQGKRAFLAGKTLGEESARQVQKVVSASAEEFEKAAERFEEIGPIVRREDEAAIIRAKQQLGIVEQRVDVAKSRLSNLFLTPNNLNRFDEFVQRASTHVEQFAKKNDILSISIGGLSALFIATATAVNPFLGALAAIATTITLINENWNDLKRSIEWVWENKPLLEPFRWIGEKLGVMQGRPAPSYIPTNATSPGAGPPPQTNVTQYIEIRGDTTFEDAIKKAERRADLKRRFSR